MDREQAVAAARAAGMGDDAETYVAIAAGMGTSSHPCGTLIVCAAGNFAVETLDSTPAAPWTWRVPR